RQLLAQEIDLPAELLRAARVGPLGRLGELGLEVVEPLAVRGARGRVEHLARVAETGNDRAPVASAGRLDLAAGGQGGPGQLRARAPQQACDVLHALRVLQPEALAIVGDRPDVALAPEYRGRLGSRRAFRSGRRARLLAEAGRGPELHHFRFEQLHADLARRGQGLRREPRRPVSVAWPVACDPPA